LSFFRPLLERSEGGGLIPMNARLLKKNSPTVDDPAGEQKEHDHLLPIPAVDGSPCDPRIVIALLVERFPAAFFGTDRKPLKIGICADLLAALDGAVAESDLKAALFAYVTSVTYLNAVRAGADRLDLAGQPAGAVTSDHERCARFRFFHIHIKPLQEQRLKKQREQRAKKREAKPAPHKADGLSALKAAWRARQGGAS
jgi:sRNA-binding protein